MPEASDLAGQKQLHLEPRDTETVRQVLARFVPRHQVWAFGSRAHGRHVWRFSDLDLAIEGLTWQERVKLKDAFDESLLPILVDVVDLDSVDPAFAARIRPDFVVVQTGASEAVPVTSRASP